MRYRARREGRTYNPEIGDIERARVLRVCVCRDDDGNRARGDETSGHGGDSNEDGGELHFELVDGLLVVLETCGQKIGGIGERALVENVGRSWKLKGLL